MSETTTEFGLSWKPPGSDKWRLMSFRVDSEIDARSWLASFQRDARAAGSGSEYRLMSRTVTRTESAWETVE